MVTPLYLLRHGPTEASGRAPLGRLDVPVLPDAETRWRTLRPYLLSLGLARVLTSPLQRARLHAEDLGLPCLVLDDLGEQDWGAWDGVPWDHIPGAEAFLKEPIHGVPPGGESFATCAERAIACLERHVVAGSPTLILAHAGVLRGIFAALMGLPLPRGLDVAWDPFGLTRVDLVEVRRGVLRWHNRVEA